MSQASSFKPSIFKGNVKPSISTCIPAVTVKKDEIYVDVFEKLTVFLYKIRFYLMLLDPFLILQSMVVFR